MLDRALVEGLTRAVADAAEAILAIGRDAIDVRTKANATPVTAADERSQSLLVAAVGRLMPGVDVVAEEMASLPALPGDPFVLIDPLDGTKEYVAGSGEYTVNLAVVAGGTAGRGLPRCAGRRNALPGAGRPAGPSGCALPPAGSASLSRSAPGPRPGTGSSGRSAAPISIRKRSRCSNVSA